MDEERFSQIPGPVAAPPTQPGALQIPEPRSSWPPVVGVIGIVLGCLGALGAIWGLIAPWMTGMYASATSDSQQIMKIASDWRWWSVLSSVLTLAVAMLLFVAGVGCTKRRRWARPACMTWACLKALIVVLNTGIGWVLQQQIVAEVSRQNLGGSAYSASVAIGAGIGIVIGLAWSLALPVFMLIWFSRARIKAEVAEWR